MKAQAVAGIAWLAGAGLVLLLMLAGACIWLGSARTGDGPVGSAKKHDGLFPIATRDGFGYIDCTGRVVIKPQYKLAFEFSEGLAAVYVGGEWVEDKGYGRKIPSGGKFGYIDTTGKLGVEPRFDLAERFSEGLAAVNLGGQWRPGPPGGMGPPPAPPGGKWGFIDRTGKMVIEARLIHCSSSFKEGLALVQDGNMMVWLDREGQRVEINAHSPFSEGLARTGTKTADGYKVGFVDRSGRTVIKPQFDRAEDFSEGLAAVAVGDKWGFVNTRGRVVIRPQFEHAYPFREGLAGVRIVVNGATKRGYVNRRGRWVIEPNLDEAGCFSEGLADAYRGDQAGFIDKTGRFVITVPRMIPTLGFSGGLARVNEGYMDKTGKYVWRLTEGNSR